MASIYKRHGSKYWWVKYRNTAGKVVRESTMLRNDNGPDKRRAQQLAADHTHRESKMLNPKLDGRWDQWVDEFFNSRYQNSPLTLLRYLTAWRTIKMFLEDKEIVAPRQLTREQCSEYIDWRKHADKRRGKYTAGHNTSIEEIKILGIVMTEAVLRNHAPFNPCRELQLHRAPQKQKPEYTLEQLEKIADRIELEPEPRRTFFRNSFLIGRYHGCRLAETQFNPMTQVVIRIVGKKTLATISFRAKKGRIHTVNLHPKLIPLFKKLQAERQAQTYPPQKSPAKTWFLFLQRIGMKKESPGACFHSLRVTAATALARSPEVSEKKAMAYLGHASTTVHRAYVRLRADDLNECSAAML